MQAGGVNPFVAGLTCRCPNCGEGPLFSGFLKVADRCEACGFDLGAADSGDGPVVFIVLIAGGLVCFAALFTEIAFRPPVWVHLILWLPLAVILTLGLMRPFKGVMLANPLAYGFETVRTVLVAGRVPDPAYLGLYLVCTWLYAAAGLVVFRRLKGGFADVA